MAKEIAIFKVNRAYATYQNGVLNVNLFYPRNPLELNARLPGNPAFGASVLETLLTEGETQIASPDAPLKPADGGSIYLFTDNVILVHRRDKGAGVHKLYHGAPGGYTDTLDSTFSEAGLLETGLKETAEEQLLITGDGRGLYVLNDSREHTLATARRLKIDLDKVKPLYINADTLPSRDRLRVFYEDGTHIFTSFGRGFLDMMWDDSTSFSLMQVRLMPISSEEILPIDTEGMMKGDRFIHFNRESYFIPLSDLQNKPFGTPMTNPRVYQSRIENGVPVVYTPEYQKPFLGPDGVEVTRPHIWAPENHTTVCLDALGVPGYFGKRLDIELWKNQCRLNGTPMVPEEFLVK
jgi:hypothetical protein